MNLTDLVNAVYTETGRPDMVDETLNAVVASTMKMHCRGRYKKDLQEAKIVFDYCSYIQQLDTSALPLYRNMYYMRPGQLQDFGSNGVFAQQSGDPLLPPLWDWNFYPAVPMFKMIDGEDILDIFGCEKTDVMYQAGTSLNIKASCPFKYAQCGWFKYPNIDTSNNGANFDSWIAREIPYAIIYDAAATVFTKKGQQDISRTYSSESPENPGLVVTWLRLLDMNNTLM
jgi:hypothetical protein